MHEPAPCERPFINIHEDSRGTTGLGSMYSKVYCLLSRKNNLLVHLVFSSGVDKYLIPERHGNDWPGLAISVVLSTDHYIKADGFAEAVYTSGG
jgi:hypothetical protein